MGMGKRTGQYLFNPSPGQFSAVLVSFLNDLHANTDPDCIPVFSTLLAAHKNAPDSLHNALVKEFFITKNQEPAGIS
jgi:hypothetical protein